MECIIFSYFRREDQIAKFELLKLNFCSLVKINGLIKITFLIDVKSNLII